MLRLEIMPPAELRKYAATQAQPKMDNGLQQQILAMQAAQQPAVAPPNPHQKLIKLLLYHLMP